MKILTQSEISELAESALSSYEMTANWNAAKERVIEDCIEFHRFKPSKSLVLLCIKVAQMGWNEITLKTRQAIES